MDFKYYSKSSNWATNLKNLFWLASAVAGALIWVYGAETIRSIIVHPLFISHSIFLIVFIALSIIFHKSNKHNTKLLEKVFKNIESLSSNALHHEEQLLDVRISLLWRETKNLRKISDRDTIKRIDELEKKRISLAKNSHYERTLDTMRSKIKLNDEY